MHISVILPAGVIAARLHIYAEWLSIYRQTHPGQSWIAGVVPLASSRR